MIVIANPVVTPGDGGVDPGTGSGGTGTGTGAEGGASSPVIAPAASFSVDLIGVDGSKWDLINGPVRLAPGPQLFGAAEVTNQWTTSPVLDGGRRVGFRSDIRRVVMPTMVLGSSWQEWRDTDSAFFRAIDPSGEVTIVVTSPDSRTRSLNATFVVGGDLEINPLDQFFGAYVLEFEAGNPFFFGDPISRALAVQPARNLFPGPPFNINASSVSQGGTVTNPGDLAAWPRYTITGPASTFSFGIGDSLISSSTPLVEGESVTVDTAPGQASVTNQDGESVYLNMDAIGFAAIPAGADVDVSLTVTGFTAATTATVDFTPLYRRPW